MSHPTHLLRRNDRTPSALATYAKTLALVGVLAAQACDAGPAATTPATPPAPAAGQTAQQTTPAPTVAPADAPGTTRPNSEMQTMEVKKAVVVTVELDYGGTPPKIADAIKDIERKYQPADGQGRTFAILDATGEATPDNKLRLSMHISSEKAGAGSLVFRRTGETLWQTRILPGESNASPYGDKQLRIFLNDGKGADQLLDGSKGPASILDAVVQNTTTKVRDIWPDGETRDMTFIYSACGCPVHVNVKRTGERTVRAGELPVMFPDDPAVVQSIAALMRW